MGPRIDHGLLWKLFGRGASDSISAWPLRCALAGTLRIGKILGPTPVRSLLRALGDKMTKGGKWSRRSAQHDSANRAPAAGRNPPLRGAGMPRERATQELLRVVRVRAPRNRRDRPDPVLRVLRPQERHPAQKRGPLAEGGSHRLSPGCGVRGVARLCPGEDGNGTVRRKARRTMPAVRIPVFDGEPSASRPPTASSSRPPLSPWRGTCRGPSPPSSCSRRNTAARGGSSPPCPRGRPCRPASRR